jgi:hypothetical protein
MTLPEGLFLAVWSTGLLPGNGLHTGSGHSVPDSFCAACLLWQEYSHFAIQKIEGEVRLASHQGAECPLQDSDLLGTIHAANLERHSGHCCFPLDRSTQQGVQLPPRLW